MLRGEKMEKYYWDVETVRARKKEIEERIKSKDNTFTQKQWKEILDDLDAVINCFTVDDGKLSVSFDAAMKKDKDFLKKYGVVGNYLEKFFYTMCQVKIKNEPFVKHHYTISTILKIMEEIFQSLGDVYFGPFQSIMGNFADHHHFFKGKQTSLIDGSMMPVRHLNEVYTATTISTNITDIIYPVHEIGHGIEFLLNPKGFANDNNRVAWEIVPTFLEFVACDRLTESYGLGNEVKKYFNVILSDALDRASKALYIQDAVNIADKLKGKKHYEIIKIVAKDLSLERSDVHKLLTLNTIDDLFTYSFAFMIAVELYMIYREDPKKALRILRGLIAKNNYSTREYLKALDGYGCLEGKRRDEFKLLLK